MKFSEALKLVLVGKTMCLKENINYRLRMNGEVFENWGMHFQPPRWHTSCVGSVTDTNNEWIEYTESFDFFEAVRRIEKGEKLSYITKTDLAIYKKDGKLVARDSGGEFPSSYLDPRAQFISVP